ncbi:heme-binding protein [Lentisphaerota bacterium WC36G]|nr:heme-binding protein [Lentisphaerae bacterium WC36]
MRFLKLPLLLLTFVFLSILACCCSTAPKAYEPSAKGKVVEKNLPELKAYETSCEGNYYNNSNRLFRRLFNYLNSNKLSMTIPIEVSVEPAKMIFIINDNETDKKLADSDLVTVITLPPRKVLSYGMTGRYSQENFNKGKEELEKYLLQNPQYQKDGDFFAVYWDNPMVVPPFMRRSEISVPIKKKLSTDKELTN